MMHKILSAAFIIILFFCTQRTQAQGGVAIGSSGAKPDSLAMLDVRSTTKGFLPPRFTTAQRTTLAASLNAVQTGMQVADNFTGRVYTWTGAAWSVEGYAATSPISIEANTNAVALNAGTAAGDLLTWDGNNWISAQPASAGSFSITYDNRQPYLALNYCISIGGIYPSRNSGDPFVGEIQVFGFNFPPQAFALCDGSIYSISQYTTLFSLLGTTYGGDGVTTFALPDLRGRLPIHMGQGIGLTDRPIGSSGGAESATVTH